MSQEGMKPFQSGGCGDLYLTVLLRFDILAFNTLSLSSLFDTDYHDILKDNDKLATDTNN